MQIADDCARADETETGTTGGGIALCHILLENKPAARPLHSTTYCVGTQNGTKSTSDGQPTRADEGRTCMFLRIYI